jgi:hypothetical protein
MADKRTNARGVNPPKKRGPKPDSKPALTRRQELNRQAQRTHRERKELYIKTLEDEVLRLKEVYTTVTQAQDQLANENKQLREALQQHGISLPGSPMMDGISGPASISGYSQTSGPTNNSLSPVAASQSTAPSLYSPINPAERRPTTRFQPCSATLAAQRATQQAADLAGVAGVDVEQAGIDFVLTLEKPCMAHMPVLLDMAADARGPPCGHVLMATCPPKPFDQLTPETPFGHNNVNNGTPQQGTWELSKANLSVLLDLSKQLNLDGEITPVMAWSMVMGHERFGEFQRADLARLAEELSSKIRCYG